MNLYNKNQFQDNYMIDENILKKTYEKKWSPY